MKNLIAKFGFLLCVIMLTSCSSKDDDLGKCVAKENELMKPIGKPETAIKKCMENSGWEYKGLGDEQDHKSYEMSPYYLLKSVFNRQI